MGDDQAEFLDAGPTLDLLFSGDGGFDVCEALEVDEGLDVVLGGEAVGIDLVFVLQDSVEEVGGYADVEVFEPVGEDVDVGDFLH